MERYIVNRMSVDAQRNEVMLMTSEKGMSSVHD